MCPRGTRDHVRPGVLRPRPEQRAATHVSARRSCPSRISRLTHPNRGIVASLSASARVTCSTLPHWPHRGRSWVAQARGARVSARSRCDRRASVPIAPRATKSLCRSACGLSSDCVCEPCARKLHLALVVVLRRPLGSGRASRSAPMMWRIPPKGMTKPVRPHQNMPRRMGNT